MPDWSSHPSEAVVICTRNRPEELSQTLQSVSAQTRAEHRPVLVVDGSDPVVAEHSAQMVKERQENGAPVVYHQHEGHPAGTRQRNTGIDLLPSSVDIVHFIDDDTTVQAGYFDTLSEALRETPSLLGVGGVITTPNSTSARPPVHWGHRLFLLRTDQPSRVLPSGQTTPAWPLSDQSLQRAEWLSTCASSYRREVFDRHRFDPAATGPSPRLEDLDFSFRVAQEGPLAVAPEAECIHRFSPQNRRGAATTAQERVARRYWFVEKNLNHPLNRLAFWWSVVGRLLAAALSSAPESSAVLRGLLRGIKTVWTRDHPLLRSGPSDP